MTASISDISRSGRSFVHTYSHEIVHLVSVLSLVFCHFLLDITFYYKLPLSITFFISLATHQYHTCMQENLPIL